MIFQRVKAYCEENNLSISSFEKKCNIGNGTISRWENDDSKPSLATLEKIEKATGIRIEEWLR
ncbi:MAG: helix-turn-helix domain-containing protein [Lachnospiraceae bacterium]